MAHISELIVPGAKAVRGYAERLLSGITEESFARKPYGVNGTIDTNHPAFVFGHLSRYPALIAELLGAIGGPEKAAPEYDALFKDGAVCRDDTEGGIYPKMNVITTKFFTGTDWLIRALPDISNESFFEVMPDEKRRQRFPTIGSFVIYLSAAHANGHLGQISAWRRCMGLPAA